MKQELVRFACDSCGTTVDSVKEDGYPYKIGWQYLYQLEGKTGKADVTHKLAKDVGHYKEEDKHFCSTKCMYSFIGNVVKATREGNPEPIDTEYKTNQVQRPMQPQQSHQNQGQGIIEPDISKYDKPFGQ